MFPRTEELALNAPANSFLATLLSSALAGKSDPLLAELESRLVLLQSVGVDLTKELRGHLRGAKPHFFSGVAEIFALSWLQSRGLLREVGVDLNPGESVSGKSCQVDGSIGLSRGKLVLFDVKSVQAHMDRYLRDIRREVEAEVRRQGHCDLNFAHHVKGSPVVCHVRDKQKQIAEAALKAIPAMLNGKKVQIWNNPAFRLLGTLQKDRFQSSFRSVAGDIQTWQARFWSQCHQISQTRPFVIVLVRTSGMGLETGDLPQLLDDALKGNRAVRAAPPVFGSTSTEMVPKTKQTKTHVQRHLSAVLFIDERPEAKKVGSKLIVNKYAKYPLPRALQLALR